MKSGISTNSRSLTATFAAVSGSWSGNYPVTNLADLHAISKVARVTPATGAAAFTFVLPAAVSMQFIAFVRHNLPAGATFRVRLFSDNNPDPSGNAGAIVADSTVTSVWSSGALVSGYSPTRPYLFSAAATARSGRIDLASLSGDAELGGFEIGDWWEWPGLAPGKEGGFVTAPRTMNLLGGAIATEDAWMPRKLDGEITFLALGIAATTGIDFQKDKGLAKPFVYVQDMDDSTSWPRQCWLARNVAVPPSIGRLYRHDTFQFRFREHWR